MSAFSIPFGIPSGRTGQRLFTALGLAALFACGGDRAAKDEPRGGPIRRALIVAIGRYSAETEWHNLHTDSDRAFVHAALLAQGFTAIDEITDERATRAGIERAFRERLIDRARPGDVVVFHYSGHGQQIADDDGDELDGYDEALVPYDAPQRLRPGYGGERHLRDDSLDEWMTVLRRKVGAEGQVIVFLDSCVSGTPRGGPGEADEGAVRGGAPPLGPPRNGAGPRGDEGQFGFLGAERGTRAGGGDQRLAPDVVISAARHNQPAYETVGEDGRPIGSLSWALGLELGASNVSTTYRDLFERIHQRMRRRVSHEPQIEGPEDQLLWIGGAVEQAPFFTVQPMRAAGEVEIDAGTLAGILRGSQVEIHRAGSPKPLAESKLAQGTVVSATMTTATVKLDRAIASSELPRARAFLTRASLGGLELRVEAHALPAPFAAALRQRVAQALPMVRWVDSRSDVHIDALSANSRPVEIHAATAAGVPIVAPLPLGDGAIDDLVAALGDNLRSRYLRRLYLRPPAFDVRLELVPHDSGADVWQVGKRFDLFVNNRSSRPAFVTVLDLTSDGRITSYWPDPRTGEKTEVPARTRARLGASYEMTEPLGRETLLLIASDQWIDFRPILTRAGVWNTGAAKGALGPFAPLFELGALGEKGMPLFEPGEVATWAITGQVTPRRIR